MLAAARITRVSGAGVLLLSCTTSSVLACHAVLDLEDHVLTDAGPDAAGGTAGAGGTGGAAGASTTGVGGCIEEEVTVLGDEDDAVWSRAPGDPDERLKWDGNGEVVVSNDSDLQCTGLRFLLPSAPGAHIQNASLRLTRVGGTNTADDTIRIQVWETPDVPPFMETHAHHPEGHTQGGKGMAVPTVVNWKPGVENGPVEVDVTVLVQHLVGHAEYQPDHHVGFLLTPQAMGGHYVNFADTTYTAGSEPPATLRVEHCGR